MEWGWGRGRGLTLAGYFHSVSGYAGFGEAVGFLEVLAAAGAGVAGDWGHGGGEVGVEIFGGGGNVEGKLYCSKRGYGYLCCVVPGSVIYRSCRYQR